MKAIVTRIVTLLLPGLLAMPCTLSAGDIAYRVTGIMGSDTGITFAVIENTDGQQQLLKEGSAIGPGYVKSISSREKVVVLAFPTGEQTLRLRGSGRPNVVTEEFSMEEFYAETQSKSFDATAVSQLLKLARSAKNLSESEINLQLNELLGFSQQTQFAAFNDQRVNSAREVLEQLGDDISSNEQQDSLLGTIAISDQAGSRRVYLTIEPADDLH